MGYFLLTRHPAGVAPPHPVHLSQSTRLTLTFASVIESLKKRAEALEQQRFCCDLIVLVLKDDAN